MPATAARAAKPAAARSAKSAAGRGTTTPKAGNIDTLAAKLAPGAGGRGQLVDALTGLGFSPKEAREAAGKVTPDPAPKPKPAAAKKRPAAASSTAASSTPASSSGGGLSVPTFHAPAVGGSASGFALGIVGTAVLINYMHGGMAQVKAWAGAKFLNRTAAAAAAPAGPAKPAAPKRAPVNPPTPQVPDGRALTTRPFAGSW